MKKRTLSPQTSARYHALVTNLRKRVAYKEKKLPNEVDLPTICRYLINQHRTWKAPTWRTYRAAMFHVYGYGMSAHALTVLSQIPGGGKKPDLPLQGPSFKMKSFPDLMMQEIFQYLTKSNTRNSKVLWLWLTVGIETGLRPSEWFNAELVTLEGVLYLKVKNAKNSNGRANGDYRHLDLSRVSPFLIDLIRRKTLIANAPKDLFPNSTEKAQAKYNNYYNACRRRLHDVVRRLWPNRDKYPSLYSLRHQFIANAKADGFTLEEIAAMCGQASAETSAIHYGRRQHGSKGNISVRPKKEEVLSVRKGSEFVHRNNRDEA